MAPLLMKDEIWDPDPLAVDGGLKKAIVLPLQSELEERRYLSAARAVRVFNHKLIEERLRARAQGTRIRSSCGSVGWGAV